MSTPIRASWDFLLNPILNVCVDPLASDPTADVTRISAFWFNTATLHFMGCDGSANFRVPRIDSSAPTSGGIAETVATTWKFVRPGGAGTAPFLLDATNNGTVPYLNADMLDGYHGATTVTVNTAGIRYTDGRLRVGTPVEDYDATTKAYVDAITVGFKVHTPCVAATTANIANLANATVTHDDIVLVEDDRLLVKNQTAPAENGVYVVGVVGGGTAALTRSTEEDATSELAAGTFILVKQGTVYASSCWVQTTVTPTIGSDPIVWQQAFQAQSYAAGNGLGLTGTTFYFKSNGTNTYTQYCLFYADTTSTIDQVPIGTSGQMLQSQGVSAPEWTDATWPSTATAGDILYASGSNVWSGLAAGTNGKVLTMVAGAPAWATNAMSHHSLSDLTGYDDHTQYALLAGRAGGQTLNGGTASGDDLTIDSTAHATKGDIFLNPTGGRVTIGTATPTTDLLTIYGSTNGQVGFSLYNANAGGAAYASFRVGNNVASYRSDYGMLSSAYTSSGGFIADGAFIRSQGVGGMSLISTDASTATACIRFYVSGSADVNLAMLINRFGSIGIGTASPATLLDVNGVINAATGYRIANAAALGYYLRGNGTNFVASVIGVADITFAGTQFGVPYYATATTLGTTAAPVSANVLLHGNTAGAPTWSAVSLTADVTGILPLANGGTSSNLSAVNGAVTACVAGAMAFSAAGTVGQILLSGGSGLPTWASTIPAGTTIDVFSIARKVIGSFTGAEIAGGTVDIAHNLNTYDVQVEVYEDAGNKVTTYFDILRTGVNTVRIACGIAPTAGDTFRVVIVG